MAARITLNSEFHSILVYMLDFDHIGFSETILNVRFGFSIVENPYKDIKLDMYRLIPWWKVTKIIFDRFWLPPWKMALDKLKKCFRWLLWPASCLVGQMPQKTQVLKYVLRKVPHLPYPSTPGSRPDFHAQNSDAQNLDFCVPGTWWGKKKMGSASEFPWHLLLDIL